MCLPHTAPRFISLVYNASYIFSSYQVYGEPDFVAYTRFSDEIESVFTTKHLEKAPLQDVPQFQAAANSEENYLNEGAHAMLDRVLQRIADRVRSLNCNKMHYLLEMNLFHLFNLFLFANKWTQECY